MTWTNRHAPAGSLSFPRVPRQRRALIALLAVIAVSVAGCGGRRPIARVDGSVVTEGQWLQRMIMKHGAEQLIAMIDEAIITEQASRLGIDVSEEQVRAKLEEVIALIGSRSALEERLDELHMTMDELRRRVRVLALLDELVRRHVKVTEDDMWNYFQRHRKQFRHGPMVRARLMLFSSKESAEAVLQALQAGGDFAGLAKALSEDPGTREAGGDTGWFERDDYAPEISKVAFSLKPGQLSGVFKGPDGWYILKVEDKRPAGEKRFDDVRDQIKARLISERMIAERAKWLAEKRAEASIVIKDRRLARAVRARLRSAPPPTPLPGLVTPDMMFARGAG